MKGKRGKLIKRTLLVLFILYATPCVLVYLFQEMLLFHPTVLEADHLFESEYPFEEVDLTMSDGTLINALHFKDSMSEGVVVFFHGNGGSLQSWSRTASDIVPKGYDLFIMDYRGYGKSTGEICKEQTLFEDAQEVYDHVALLYGQDKIVVYGSSIGTGIAAHVASKNTPWKLVLETPYYSMTDLASSMYPFLPTFILRYPLRTDQYLPNVSCPTLLLHGTKDEVIYYGSSEKLHALVPSTTFVTIEDGNHNNLSDYDRYHTALEEFLYQ